MLQEVSDAGVSVKWGKSGIELMQVEEVMPWVVKKEKPVEDAVLSLPGIKWSPTSNNHNNEMVVHLAKGALYQVYLAQSAAHNEIHVVRQDSAASQDKPLSPANVAVFARKEFKAGALAILPFNLDLVEGSCKRPAGAVPLEIAIMPDGEAATRVPFWVRPVALPKATTVSQQRAAVMVPFWLMAKSSQQPKKVAAASQEVEAACHGVEDGNLIYKTASFELNSPSALGKGGRNVKSKVRMRILYLTNDMNMEKGARLVVKGDMPAELEEDLTT